MVISEKLPGNKLCVDLIGPTTRRKDRPKFNILATSISLNPPSQKVYITHNKAISIRKFGRYFLYD